jgi:hypothetical protein
MSAVTLTGRQVIALFGRSEVEESFRVCRIGAPDREGPVVVHYEDRSMVVQPDGTVTSQSTDLKAAS